MDQDIDPNNDIQQPDNTTNQNAGSTMNVDPASNENNEDDENGDRNNLDGRQPSGQPSDPMDYVTDNNILNKYPADLLTQDIDAELNDIE